MLKPGGLQYQASLTNDLFKGKFYSKSRKVIFFSILRSSTPKTKTIYEFNMLVYSNI